jgi:hypothetical protein
MPSRARTAAAALAALAAAAAPAAGSTPAGVDLALAAPATVKVLDCSRESRSASFRARMGQIVGGERMALRFTLLERRLGRFEVLHAPGLGRWRRSKPGVGAFGYRQTVRGLAAGSVYRMQVDYRWLDAEGRVVARARRRSAPCRQFADLPNLTARLVDVARSGQPGVSRYRVRLANTGVAAASSPAVRLAVDGAVVDTETLVSLAPFERRLLTFHGPECQSSVTVAADPDGVLVEAAEDDNVQTLACADLPAR